jgi:cell division protease FtsH
MEVLSIIKRRASLGLLAHTDLEERFTQTRSELEAMLAIALGGMAAEELFFGESGTGPMAGSLISYEAVAEGMVARRNLVGKVLSDPDAKRRVEELLDAQKERVAGVLAENRDLVEALRDALIARDELVGDDITRVIEQALARRSTGS